MSAREHRRAEVRAAGRRLIGTPMVYGAEAQILMPDGRPVTERFASFAFAEYLGSGAETRLNLMHDGELVVASTQPGDRGLLELRDSPDNLSMIATLPTGDVYDQVLNLVQDGDAAELSVEFRAQDEQLLGDRRTVRKATLPAIGVVDSGAYPQSVEVRARGRGLAGRFEYGRDRVTRDRGRRRKVRVNAGAFSWQMERWQKLQEELGKTIAEAIEEGLSDAQERAIRETREVNLLAGRSYDRPLASLHAGTLLLNDGPEALEFEVEELPATQYADDLLEVIDSGAADVGVDLLYSIPPEDVVPDAVSIEPDAENPEVEVEVVNQAVLNAIAVVNRAPRGNPGKVERRRLATPERRLRVWL
ncbi:MAG: HK97 family phage prohead protease [Spirochaetaceae bacterium]|nr:HK97 family phage prohead protease [Spirochaetaceae bacterium]